jgi:spore maturation protein CgeB
LSGRARIVVLGLAITSSWGNGHAVTFRGLLRELSEMGHEVWFLERDVPWYADNRDQPEPEGVNLGLYTSLADLKKRFGALVRDADAVVVGSYVPEGCEVIRWVQRTARGATGFYDIDTPVTLAKLDRGDEEYLSRELIPGFDVYFSFTGGPTLERLERQLGAKRAVALYCAVDPQRYRPSAQAPRWDLGYLGTWSADRQPVLDRLLVEAARRRPSLRFTVAGPCYPADIEWPDNVERTDHVAPGDHPRFYGSQRFTLNVTRADMVRAGWSPSVRLFEAAACGVPILSDVWEGLDVVFGPGEILPVRTTADVLEALNDIGDEERERIAAQARRRVLTEHTAAHRARELASQLGVPRREAQAAAYEGSP